MTTWLVGGMYVSLEQGSVPPEVFDAQAVPGAHLLHVPPESVNSAAVRDTLLAQPPNVLAQMVDGSARSVAVGLDKAGAFARANALGLPVLLPDNTLAGVEDERILAIDAQGSPAQTPAVADYVLVLPEPHLLTQHPATRRELDASPSQVLIGPPMLSQVRFIDADKAELGIPPLILDTLIDQVGGIAGVEELAASTEDASPVQGGVIGLWRALAALKQGDARLVTVTARGDETAMTVLALRFPGGVGLLHDTPSGVRAATLPRRPGALSIAPANVSEKASALVDGSALAYPWLRGVNPEREGAPTADAFTLNCVITAIAVDLSLIDGHGHQASGVDTATGPEDRGLPESYLANYQAQTLRLPDGESRVYSFGDLEAVRDVMAAAQRGARGLVLIYGEDARTSHAFNVVHDAYGVSFLDGQRGGLARPPQVITDVALLPLTDNIEIPNEHPLTVLSPDRRAGAFGFEVETRFRTDVPMDLGIQVIATSRNLDIHLDQDPGETIIELVSKPYNVLDGETRHRPRDEVWHDFTQMQLMLQRIADAGRPLPLKALFHTRNGFSPVREDILNDYHLNGYTRSDGPPADNMYTQYTVGVTLSVAYRLLQFTLQHTWADRFKGLTQHALDFADGVARLYRTAMHIASTTDGGLQPTDASLARDIMDVRGLAALAYTHVLAPVLTLANRHAEIPPILVKNELLAASRTSLAAIRDLLSERARNWLEANANMLRVRLAAHALGKFPRIRRYLDETEGGGLLDREMPGKDDDYRLGSLLDTVLLGESPSNRELTQDNVFGIRTNVGRAHMADNGDRLILLELRHHGLPPLGGLAEIKRTLDGLETHIRQVARSTAAIQAETNSGQDITASFPFTSRSRDLTAEHRSGVEEIAARIVQRIVASGSGAMVLVEGGGKRSVSDAGAQRATVVADALTVSALQHLDAVGLAASRVTVLHRSRGDGDSQSPHPAQRAAVAADKRTVVLWLDPPAPQQTGQMRAWDIETARFGSAGADVETREVASDYTDESLHAAYPWLGQINPGHAGGGEYATNCVMAALSLDLSLQDGSSVFETATNEPLDGVNLLNYQQQVLKLADDEHRVYGIPSIEAAVEALRAAAPGSRALIAVRRPESQVNHVFVGIRDERGVAVVDPQTGRLGRLPLDTTGLTLIPLSHDIAPPTPATVDQLTRVLDTVAGSSQAVDTPPVTVSVQLDSSGAGAHLDSAAREQVVTLSAQAVAAARRSGPLDVQVDGGWSRNTSATGNAAARSQVVRVQAILDYLMPLIRRGLADLGLHRDTVTVDVVRRGSQMPSATQDATSAGGLDQYPVTVRLLPARRLAWAELSSADQHMVLSVNELLVRHNRNASAAVILDARDEHSIRQTDIRGIVSAVAERIRSGGLSGRMPGGSQWGVGPQYGHHQSGAGGPSLGLRQAQIGIGSSSEPNNLAGVRQRLNPLIGHLVGLAASDGSVSFQAVADARPDVRTLFLQFTARGVDVGPIVELTRSEPPLGGLPGGRNRPRRPVRIIINVPEGEAGQAVLDQLRREFRGTGREAFAPAAGSRVVVYGGDLAVVNGQGKPGEWVPVGAERPTRARYYKTDPYGRLGRSMTDPRFMPTEDELVWWMVRDSTLPVSLESPTGESTRPFGLELEFNFDPSLPEEEHELLRGRMLNELRELGLTQQFVIRDAHSARQAGYNSRRSGWTFENDASVAGEVVSPILPYRQASGEERTQVWRDVALVLAVIRRHGGRTSKDAGGHVHLGVGDYQRDVATMQRMIDLFRDNQDILYRLASVPGQRLHRGTLYAAPIAPPAASGQQREWPDFDLRRDGGIDNRDTALNREPLLDAYWAGRPAKDDHLEIRIFDADLSLGGVQLRTELSRALADKATEPSSHIPRHSALGEHFLRWDPDHREDAAALERILDLLPAEAAAARVRVRQLWPLTSWQMPINVRTSYHDGLFFPKWKPDRHEWEALSPVAERNPRQPVFIYQPGSARFHAANPVSLSTLLGQWVPAGAGATAAIAHGVVIALGRTQVDYFNMLPRTLGVSVILPTGNQWSVEAIPGGGGWQSVSGWELLTRNADGFPITRPLGEEFGPDELEWVLKGLRTIGPVSSAPVAGTISGRRGGLVLGTARPQLSLGDGLWLGDDVQPVVWRPLPGVRGGWALLPDRDVAQVGDLELLGGGDSVPVVVHPAVGGTVRVPVRDLGGVGQDVAGSMPMVGGSTREVRLSAQQLAPLLGQRLPPGAPVALLSCKAGELPDGFARQLATALGRDVVAATRDLVVEPSGGQTRLFTVGGESWVLFTPDFGDGWDVMNDEIDGFVDEYGVAHEGTRVRHPFDGIASVAPPEVIEQPPVEAVAVSADTVVEAVGAPSWSVRLLGGVRVEHPNVYVLDVVGASRPSEEVARQALITRLGEMADGDHPVVMLWAPRLNTEPLVSDVAALNYLLEQLAQRGQLPVVVSRTKVTDALVTVTRRYGAAIVHTTTRKPNNVSIGLDTYWTASPSSQEDHPDTSRSTFAQITRDLLSQAVTLAHRTPAVARVEDTLGELIWAPNLTAARDVFTTARQRWSTQQIRDNLNRVRQMIERVPDQPDLARYAPVLEFGARGHEDIVFDYALADPVDRPTTLLTAVGNLEARGQLNSDPEAGLTATQLAAMVTTVGTTGITISVLNVIRDIKKGEFTTAATYINQHKGRLTSDEKGHWVQAIADLQRVPAMEKNRGALEELAAEVMNC
ncbi:toxin glutamine deamidase domain-containing protein [Micromonospora sp. DT4]|uniref:toxin glutamine deamidase domain-containing protein n=1 Tax=Micromonospora sp. DT4 TaxID=3393438 RepID=UPI003CF00D67